MCCFNSQSCWESWIHVYAFQACDEPVQMPNTSIYILQISINEEVGLSGGESKDAVG